MPRIESIYLIDMEGDHMRSASELFRPHLFTRVVYLEGEMGARKSREAFKAEENEAIEDLKKLFRNVGCVPGTWVVLKAFDETFRRYLYYGRGVSLTNVPGAIQPSYKEVEDDRF